MSGSERAPSEEPPNSNSAEGPAQTGEGGGALSPSLLTRMLRGQLRSQRQSTSVGSAESNPPGMDTRASGTPDKVDWDAVFNAGLTLDQFVEFREDHEDVMELDDFLTKGTVRPELITIEGGNIDLLTGVLSVWGCLRGRARRRRHVVSIFV